MPRLTSMASSAAHVLRSAVPSVLIATVIPLALFYVGLGLGSVVTAIVLSVVYAYGVAVYQYLRWRQVSGLLLMTLFMVTLRAGTAAASGQPYLYFVVPVAETGGFALLFLVTMLTKEPLIVRLARDFVPALAEDFASRRQLIRWLSLVWALTYLASAGTTLVLLLTQSIPVYMGAHEFAGWGWIGAGIVVSIMLCRWRAHGLYQAAMSLRHSLEASST